MDKNNLAEKEEKLEARKILMKKINFFLGNYFKIFVFLIVVVILAAGFFILLKPKYDQTVKYVNVINKQEEFNFESKKRELAKMKELLETYNSMDKSFIEKINYIAPVKKNKEELFAEINYLVVRSQLFLQSISLGGGGSYKDSGIIKSTISGDLTGKIETVNVNITVEGANYNAFKNFLSVLENNLRLVDVMNLTFEPNSNSTNLSLNVYYLKK